jgi:hypothetical protein
MTTESASWPPMRTDQVTETLCERTEVLAMSQPLDVTESVNATILLAFGPRNPWTQGEFSRSVHGIRERNESSGVRSTESVDARRVLAFGPRNQCI